MEPKNKQENNHQQKSHHEHDSQAGISDQQKALNQSAHVEADRDIAADPEFSIHSPNDDLDEGETSRLGEDIPGIM